MSNKIINRLYYYIKSHTNEMIFSFLWEFIDKIENLKKKLKIRKSGGEIDRNTLQNGLPSNID